MIGQTLDASIDVYIHILFHLLRDDTTQMLGLLLTNCSRTAHN